MLRRRSVVLGGARWLRLAGGTCKPVNTPTAMPSSPTQVTASEVKPAEPMSPKEADTLVRAIEESRAVLAANPDNAELRFRLAFALESHGDIDDAIKEYQAVIVRDPSYVWAHNNLGVLYAQKGLYEEAIGKFGEARFRDPQHETAPFNSGRSGNSMRPLASSNWCSRPIPNMQKPTPAWDRPWMTKELSTRPSNITGKPLPSSRSSALTTVLSPKP
jgi:tetratricopeptide (TPR) repeat protein